MNNIKVIVNGAFGRLGRVACDAISTHPSFDLVAKTSRDDNLKETILDTDAQLVLELTNANAVYNNSLTIIQNNARPIIGASGLTLEQISHLTKLCAEKELGGIIAPNFSLSAILMMRFAKMASPYFDSVEITETHHEKKIDSPSGTALKTAEMIAQGREHALANNADESLARGLKHQSVNIHSLRLPGFVAKQDVIFGGTGESLKLQSNCIGRDAFKSGIILALEKALEQNSLIYGLEELM